MKARVYYHTRDEADIFMEDGGAATLHWTGEYMLATYYQDRMKPEDVPEGESIWDILAEGKAYCNEYQNDDEVTDEMILEAISWLGGTVENGFEREFNPRIFPFKEGDDYWTVEDGKPIWSCWDDQSEELFMLTEKYFPSLKDVLESLFQKELKDMVCTDGDRNQYGKKLVNGHYQFMEYSEQDKEWVEMDILLKHYTDEQIDIHISAYYNSVQHIKELYEDSWEWIVAECIFEQESGLY